MTPQSLSTAAAILLSLLFSYVPGLSDWYGNLDPVRKRLIMLGMLIAVALGSLALACAGWSESPGIPLACDQPGAVADLVSGEFGHG